VPRDHRAEVLSLLAALGDAGQQAPAFAEALAPDRLSTAARVRVLGALAEAARTRRARPQGDLDRIAELFQHTDPLLSSSAIHLAGAWQLKKQWASLVQAAADPVRQRRRAAVAALVDLKEIDSTRLLAGLADDKHSYPVRLDALIGLTALDVNKAAALAAPFLKQPVSAAHDPADLFTAFLQRNAGQAALAAALKNDPPSADAARIGQRVINNLGIQAPTLRAVLQTASGTAGRGRKLDAQEMTRLIGLVKNQGNAVRGEAVYRRPALSCVQCHAIAGAGNRVGPDLATIGSSAPLDYIIESILLPSKVVKEGYTMVQVVTKDGRALSGILVRESKLELVLRDPIRDDVVISAADIEERHTGGSLMPAELDQTLTDAELADLVRFLSELGRPGPFAVATAPVARRWQYLTSVPEGLLAESAAVLGKTLTEDTQLSWSPAYSLVSGELPLDEVGVGKGSTGVVRCRVEVATPGKVQLVLNSGQGLQLWVDGKEVSVAERLELDLSRGIHTLAMIVERNRRQEARLRCELAIPASSRAQAGFVGGR
jgi:putative heme-binding domain-containing protein